MMSSGWAACPDAETTYLGFSSAEVVVLPVEEGGRVEGNVLYVYGSVVAVGSEMKGETVRGTWASRGWASEGESVSQSMLGIWEGQAGCLLLSCILIITMPR